MQVDRKIRKALMRLAQHLRVDEPITIDSSFMTGRVPAHLRHLVSEGRLREETPPLHLSGQKYESYRAALSLLLSERRSRYLTDTQDDKQLREKFWSLCCEITLDDRFRSTTVQSDRIHTFMSDVYIPDKEYEAIVQIHGISIPHRTRLGSVELIRGSPTLLREWRLWSGPRRPQWRSQTIARMTVQGGTIKAAKHRALNRASMICDELRIAFPSVIQARISDWQVGFQPGWYALRGSGERLNQLGQLPGRPVRWGQSFEAVCEFLQPVYKLRTTAHPNIQRQVELAVCWFGMSWNTGTPWAMKVIALFAGLEALLIKGEHEPRKGALLAIRHTLLSIAVKGEFADPAAALSLYYDRSELVHGADTTAEERDFLRASSLASDALENYVAIANQHKNIGSHSKLLDVLSDSQFVGTIDAWINRYRPWKYKELLAAIEKLHN